MNTQCKLSLCVIAFAGVTNVSVTNVALGQSRSDPSDAKLKSPTVEYVSPFSSYRRYQDEKPAPWRELNDQVLGLGGHAGHIQDGKDGAPGVAKPAATPEATVPSGASAPSLPAGASDPGHSSHKH